MITKKFTIGELVKNKPEFTIECTVFGGSRFTLTPELNKRILNNEIEKVTDFSGLEVSVAELLNIEIKRLNTKKIHILSSVKYAFNNCSISDNLKKEVKRATQVAAVNVLSQEKYQDELKTMYIIG